MATIAKYVAEMGVDPSGVQTGLDRAERMIREFSKTTSAVVTGSLPTTANTQVQAMEAARGYLRIIEGVFRSETGAAREALVRGAISQQEFAEAGRRAAQTFNQNLLAGVTNLRSRGLLTSESLSLLQSELTLPAKQAATAVEAVGTAGIKGASGLSRIKTELVTLGSHMLGILPVEGRVVSTLGYFAVGSTWLIAIVAGIVLIAAAWQKLTEKTREANKAAEDFKKTDEAFRAAHDAQIQARGQLANIPGGRIDMIDVVGSTKAIDDAEKAVQGFQNSLNRVGRFWDVGGALEESKQLETLRHQYAAGSIDVERFRVELAKVALKHPDAAQAIAETATLVAQYDAARDSLARLVAVEQHLRATQAEATARGPLGSLTTDLADANKKLRALQTGGTAALHAVENEIQATSDATRAWDEYVITKKGAAFATLTFTAALEKHNPIAEQAYQSALKLAEANRAVAEGSKPTKSSVEQLEQLTTRLLAWHTAAEKAGTLTSQFSGRVADAITSAEKLIAKETDRLSDNSIRLAEVLAKLKEAFLDVGSLPSIHLTPSGIVPVATPTLLRGGSASTVHLNGPPGTQGFTLPQPHAAALPQPTDLNPIRLRAALDELADHAKGAARGLGSIVASGFGAILTNIVSQLSPFSLIVKSLSDAMKPLAPVLGQIAQIVAEALTPIFEALAPIIRDMLPVFRALLGIIVPIVRALLPILDAMVPILEALFPVIKLAAIALTYVIQAASEVSSILLRMAGNIVIVIGTIFKALAQAIDALPYVSAKHAIDVAQGVIDFGRGLLTAADDFKKTADSMDGVRKEINAVHIDHTLDGIDALGDAATATAAALLNVPTWYKLGLARFNATDGVGGGGPVDHDGHGWRRRDFPKIRPPGSGGTGGTGDGGGGTGGGTGDGGGVVIHGNVYVDARTQSASELFKAIMTEGKKVARAQKGDGAAWTDAR